MSKTSLKNIQKQKKKARRTIGRPAQTRIQGNTAGVRRRLKKLAGQGTREEGFGLRSGTRRRHRHVLLRPG